MDTQTQTTANSNQESKHFSGTYKAVLISAVVVLLGLGVYFYIKNNPPMTQEEKDIRALYKTIPEGKQPAEADIEVLKNSIPVDENNNTSAEVLLKTIPSK